MSANPDCKECGGTGWLGDWPNRHGCNYCYRQTAPSDHPTPGSVLTEADVPKLRKGDVLRVIQPGGLFDDGETVCFAGVSSYGEGYIRVSGKASGFYHDRFAFVSRPQPVSVSEHVSGDAKEGVEAAVEDFSDTQHGMSIRDLICARVEGAADPANYTFWTAVLASFDAIPALASHEAQAAEIKALKEGLTLAANRMERLALATPFNSSERYDSRLWVEEARTLTERGQ